MPLVIDDKQIELRKTRFPGISVQVWLGTENGSPDIQTALLVMDPGSVLPLHTHPTAEAFFVVQGQGTMTVDGVDHAFQEGMSMLAIPGEVHGFSNKSNETLRVLCMHPLGSPITTFVE